MIADSLELYMHSCQSRANQKSYEMSEIKEKQCFQGRVDTMGISLIVDRGTGLPKQNPSARRAYRFGIAPRPLVVCVSPLPITQ